MDLHPISQKSIYAMELVNKTTAPAEKESEKHTTIQDANAPVEELDNEA